MKMSKEKRALIAGMIGCSLYVIGDFLFAATGKTQSTESIGLMVKVAYLDMATWRMVVSIICGVLGTALYYIGFHQMWKLLKRHLTQPKQQKWVKLFQIAYLTGTVCWGYVHAMFTNMALIFKFTFEKYGDMQAAAEIANKVFYCNAAPLLASYILCDVMLCVDGTFVKPEQPNGYKFETLVLDMVHMMDDCIPYEVVREREFAPIKNLHGVDSLDSARELMKGCGIEL